MLRQRVAVAICNGGGKTGQSPGLALFQDETRNGLLHIATKTRPAPRGLDFKKSS
jgi:hypothetical protein